MFKFLRRVSTSFLPRPDRPWTEDATSNAPSIGRKRRFSISEDNEGDDFGSSKRVKTESMQIDESPKDSKQGQAEGEGVKSVTQGVKQVDLEDKTDKETPVQPEGIPLPDSPRGTPQPIVQPSETPVETQDNTDTDGDSNAPSSEADPEEKVGETSDAAETEDLHPADTIASVAEDTVPPDSSPSEEAPEATEIEA
ncbi:hypothetical protein J3A83DRAFT_4092884 [Scleroderma citrinum]